MERLQSVPYARTLTQTFTANSIFVSKPPHPVPVLKCRSTLILCRGGFVSHPRAHNPKQTGVVNAMERLQSVPYINALIPLRIQPAERIKCAPYADTHIRIYEFTAISRLSRFYLHPFLQSLPWVHEYYCRLWLA